MIEQKEKPIEERGGFKYCPVCGRFFSPEHAAHKPKYCEDCGCKLGWPV